MCPNTSFHTITTNKEQVMINQDTNTVTSKNQVQAAIATERFIRCNISYEYDLTTSEKLCLWMIGSYCGLKDRFAFPIRKLAVDCSLSERRARHVIKSLQKKNLIKVNST